MKATLSPSASPIRSTPATVAANTSTRPYIPPFTIIVDTREGAPFTFTGMREDSRHDYRSRFVAVEHQGLRTGDYSIKGYTDRVTVERKSLPDLFASLGGIGGKRRENFQAEHERMAHYVNFGNFAHVVIEANRADAWLNTPAHSGLCYRAVLGYELSWFRKYGVRWWWAGGRAEAEVLTYDLLADAYKIFEREKRAERAAQRALQIEVLKNQKNQQR